MAIATYKDLCIDANDPIVVGRFWADALGLGFRAQPHGDAHLTGPSDAHAIWICGVPEQKSVKNRVHLDVRGSSPGDLVDLGASILDDTSFRWTVMADPEGGEFCFFTVDALPSYRLYEIAVDCMDHEATSRWWATVLGGRRGDDEHGFAYLTDIPNVPFDAMTFAPVIEAKTVKNRVHIDVFVDDTKRLVEVGATVVRPQDSEIGWHVMADPEGNEFCAFVS